jgi:hydrogenase expression/formation protein HypE
LNKRGNRIELAHGSGGKLTRELVEEVFVAAFRNRRLETLDDSAILDVFSGNLAFTTDAYVVRPLEFPGGDIGSLSVFGTANDLAVCGAKARFLSASFVIEEGFPIATLSRLVDSMASAATRCEIEIAAGDTKVVERGAADGMFISTAGVGEVDPRAELSLQRITPGDAIIVSGTVGDHGVAVLTEREGLEFESELISDAAPIWELVEGLLDEACDVKFMRDPTRGGLATSLLEIAEQRDWGMVVAEDSVPVSPEVDAICELLGLDPLYVANEGKLILVVASEDISKSLAVLRRHPLGRNASVIGSIDNSVPGRVLLKTTVGGTRFLDLLHEEQLPRIC